MKVGIIGAGYVGLTTAVCLASMNHDVIIYDIDKTKTLSIKNKKAPFYEIDLQNLLEQVVDSGNLQITDELDDLVRRTDGSFICVGTPTRNDSIDLSQLLEASKSVAFSMKNVKKNDYVIIVRSTIIPGTTREKIIPILSEILITRDICIAIVPEFLREGQAVHDFMNPDKIVIGSMDTKSLIFAEKIFDIFKDKSRIIKTNPETAELIKYTNNAFFSMLISFSNEIANICEKVKGVDSTEVLKALVYDKRITTKLTDKYVVPELQTYLIPGCGFGGSCFPKDVKAILHYATSNNIDTPILRAILDVNDERPHKIISLAESILNSIQGKTISILGLTFKPNTDDMRSSPSLEVIKLLKQKGANIFAYDPLISNSQNTFSDFFICGTLQQCIKNSELVILLTGWHEFKTIDGKFLKLNMKNPVIIDGRGYLDQRCFEKNMYYKIGYIE